MRDAFRKFAAAASHVTGSVTAFLVALVVVLAWAITGPLFGFSDTWQLVINTGTTIVTFLMVFLIQNTQNRDSQALHAKLDELLIHNKGADNHLIEAEDLPEAELEKLKKHYEELAGALGKSAAGRQTSPKRRKPTSETTQRRKPATTATKN
jgi:low affinity Fe/Cu permease